MVKTWSAVTLEAIRSFAGHSSATTQCLFTEKEEHLVSVASEEVIVWYMRPAQGVASARLKFVGLKVRDHGVMVVGC